MSLADRGKIGLFLLGAVCIVCAWWLISEWMTSEEDRVRTVIHEMSAAIRKADGLGVIRHLDKDIEIEGLPSEGEVYLRQLIAGYVNKFQEVELEYSIRSVEIITETEARVRLFAKADGRPKGASARRPLNDGPGVRGRTEFKLLLGKRKNGDWLIRHVSFPEAGRTANERE